MSGLASGAGIICRMVRESAGWTQAELARRLGVARSTVLRWERGARIQDKHFRRLLAAYNEQRKHEIE